jgi:hypothetical protein
VKARIAELSAKVDQAIARAVIMSKDGVLEGISETIKEALKEKKFGDAIRGYELLGKHYRLFDRAAESISWNGDPANLTDEQLDVLMGYFEKLVPPERLEAAKRRAMIEASQARPVIDTTIAPAPEEEKELW